MVTLADILHDPLDVLRVLSEGLHDVQSVFDALLIHIENLVNFLCVSEHKQRTHHHMLQPDYRIIDRVQNILHNRLILGMVVVLLDQFGRVLGIAHVVLPFQVSHHRINLLGIDHVNVLLDLLGLCCRLLLVEVLVQGVAVLLNQFVDLLDVVDVGLQGGHEVVHLHAPHQAHQLLVEPHVAFVTP